ncbi:MAG: hypothetical protein JO111_00825 [Caulobacteraceae bacterium]|nr:hypothetical protein [Caulobacteraceae bacterium]
MKTECLAALAAVSALSLPLAGVAQGQSNPPRQPSERNGLNEQLDHLNATIDRRLAHGRMSKDDAENARREITDIQAEATDTRLRDGGTISEADHFALQDRVNKLKAKIDSERVASHSQ